MILARSALRDALIAGEIKILDDEGNPFNGMRSALEGVWKGSDETEPASIDLRLGSQWLIPKPNRCVEGLGKWAHDSRLKAKYHEINSPEFIIPAHGFVLVRTQEVIELSSELVAVVQGRSSFGRFGVNTENAGLIDPGFYGSITLELYNNLPDPVILYAGTPCCQLVVSRMEGSTEGGYTGRYQGQLATKGSMLHATVPGGYREA
jgi:dCTP deaminase